MVRCQVFSKDTEKFFLNLGRLHLHTILLPLNLKEVVCGNQWRAFLPSSSSLRLRHVYCKYPSIATSARTRIGTMAEAAATHWRFSLLSLAHGRWGGSTFPSLADLPEPTHFSKWWVLGMPIYKEVPKNILEARVAEIAKHLCRPRWRPHSLFGTSNI